MQTIRNITEDWSVAQPWRRPCGRPGHACRLCFNDPARTDPLVAADLSREAFWGGHAVAVA